MNRLLESDRPLGPLDPSAIIQETMAPTKVQVPKEVFCYAKHKLYPDFEPFVAAITPRNELVALHNRQCKPKLSFVEGSWKAAYSKVKGHLFPKDFFYPGPYSFEEYLKLPQITGAKLKEAIRAIEKFRQVGLTVVDYLYSGFVKLEVTILNPYLKRPNSFDVRQILFRKGVAKLIVALWVGRVSKMATKTYKYPYSKFVYSGGMTPIELGRYFKWAISKFKYCTETDFTRWDASLGTEALDIEYEYLVSVIHTNYSSKFDETYQSFKDLLRSQQQTKGYTKWYSFKVNGTRKSGDPNTSVGNSVLNFIANGSYLETLNCDYSVLVMGDDVLLFSEKPVEPQAYEEHCLSLGLEPKPIYHTDILKASFCSGHFWPAYVDGEETFVFGVKPHRLFGKFGYTWYKDQRYQDAEFLKDLKSNNVRSLLPHNNAVPLVREYLKEEIGDTIMSEVDHAVYSVRPQDDAWKTGTYDEICDRVQSHPASLALFEKLYGFKPQFKSSRAEIYEQFCRSLAEA